MFVLFALVFIVRDSLTLCLIIKMFLLSLCFFGNFITKVFDLIVSTTHVLVVNNKHCDVVTTSAVDTTESYSISLE